MRLSRRNFFLTVPSFFGVVLLCATVAFGADNWTAATGELAVKILAHIHSKRAMALTVRNISSLGDEDASKIRRELRAQLQARGARLTASRRVHAVVQVTLSENADGYIWVADIRAGSSHEVAMLNVARPALAGFHPVAEPLSIRKTLFYGQAGPILDILPWGGATSGPAGSAPQALVLGLDSVSMYEKTNQAAAGGPAWKLRASVSVPRFRPLGRDARGKLVVGQGDSFNAYLPGEVCAGALEPALKLDCHESDDPWPMVIGNAPGAAAYFNADRNFFDGRIRSEDGRALMTSPFYSAAVLPMKSGALWLFTGLDGRVQLSNSNMDSMGSFEGWGSNIVVIQTSGCQEGWQVLATQPGDYTRPDSMQAIDVVDRKAVPASTPVDFGGPVTELWPLADQSVAIAISRNLKTSSYEAFRISITCGQ
jgi:hypothetical protein